MRLKGLVAVAACVLAVGCSSTKIKMDSVGQSLPMKEAEIMPSKAELAGTAKKVVVLPIKDDHVVEASQAKVGSTVASTVESYLSKAGMEIVDRSLAQKLKDEVAVAELKGSTGYKGPDVANFVITGELSKADLSRSFTEERQWQDKKGKWYVTPASCSFSAVVAGNLKIIEVPSLRVVETMTVDGSVSNSRETRDSSCPLSITEAQGMLRSAGEHAVERGRTDLQNYFAPKGYVLEHRATSDKVNIFKVTLGRDRGAKEGLTVHIFETTQAKNPLTGELSVEDYQVAEGVISDQVGPGYAWIIVSDQEKADKIRMGHFMKARYEDGWMQKLKNLR